MFHFNAAREDVLVLPLFPLSGRILCRLYNDFLLLLGLFLDQLLLVDLFVALRWFFLLDGGLCVQIRLTRLDALSHGARINRRSVTY